MEGAHKYVCNTRWQQCIAEASISLRNSFQSTTNCPSTAMFPTLALRNFACRITLFTRSNCKLCSDAKEVLSNVWDKRPFEYDEINVMEHSDQKWKNMYEFDTPVVGLSCTSSISMILTVL
jgi:glutaredoxin